MIKRTRYIELLNGKHKYIIDTESPNFVLKRNGELSSTIVGYKETDGSRVLIKMLHQRLMGKKEAIHRFVHEFSFQVDHPCIKCATDLLFYENRIYLIRDYVEGIDLKTIAEQKRSIISKEFVIKCALEVLTGLDELHKNQIIHCDIKPSNIILEFDSKSSSPDFENPTVKIIDFGLAHFQGEKPLSKNAKLPFSFIYSPPEQVLGYWDLINKTNDIYSLGVTIYELIGQQKPFWHENPLMVMQLQIAQQLNKNMNISDILFEIISKASNKPIFAKPPRMHSKRELFHLLIESQQRRYQDASEFRSKLQGFLKANKSINA